MVGLQKIWVARGQRPADRKSSRNLLGLPEADYAVILGLANPNVTTGNEEASTQGMIIRNI